MDGLDPDSDFDVCLTSQWREGSKMGAKNRPIKAEAEFIVVGTGAGGSTVARELAQRGKKVIMVEKGKTNKHLGGYGILTTFHRETTKEGCTSACAIMTGGSSVVNSGCFSDPPAYLKEKWGIDLSEELDETKKEFGVQIMPQNLIGATGRNILDAAGSLGYRWEPLAKMVDPSKCKEGCSDCILGCKRGAKWSSLNYLAEAREKGVLIYEGMDVQAVTHQSGKATGIWGIDSSGEEWEFRGDKVIVAAGGMNSARILMRSGLWKAGDGYFMDPVSSVFGLYTGPEEKMGTACGIPMSVGSSEFMASHGFFLYAFIAPRLVWAANQVLSNPVDIPSTLINGMRYGRLISIQAKVKDEVHGRVFVDGSISKPLTQKDYKALDTGAAISTEILIQAGCSPKTIHYEKYAGVHPGGTARIGEVVDTNLQTEIQNLYVGDSSIFPEAFGRPPTGSIVCMAKRLGKHLAAEAV
jgi:choline dehydrogenase-like flavoprotein